MGDRETLAAFDGELDELARLTKANCKPLILSLTMIAEESVHAAPAIVALICRKLSTLPPERMLTVLYLWDSLSQSKGGGRYRELFTPRLVPVMGAALERAPAAMRINLEKLFGVWRVGRVFPMNLLDELDARARRLAGVASPVLLPQQPLPPATAAATADVGAKRPRAPTPPLSGTAALQPQPQQPPPLQQQKAAVGQPVAPAPLALKHLGRQPAPLSKLPPQMAALRRDVGPFVGALNPNAELIRDADELIGMYEYLLAVEGDGAIISGRTTLVAELAELAQWRAAVGGAAAARYANPGLPPPPPPPQQQTAPHGLSQGGGAAGAAGGAPPPFPPGPCVHIFELFNALSQLEMLPLPSAVGGASVAGGAAGGGAAAARAPAVMRPFEPRSAVHRLYDGLPLQCPLSGVRFAHGAQRQLRAQMDRQFKRAQKRPAGGPPLSRAWLRPVSEWLSLYGTEQEHLTQAPTSFFGEGPAAQGDGGAAGGARSEGGGAQQAPSGAAGGMPNGGEPRSASADVDLAAARGTAVPAPAGVDLSELVCALSQEPLETFYDPEADEWMVKDAQLLPDGRLCHVKSLPATANTPGKLARRASRALGE